MTKYRNTIQADLPQTAQSRDTACSLMTSRGHSASEVIQRRVIQRMFTESGPYILNLLKLRMLGELDSVDFDSKMLGLEKSFERECLAIIKRTIQEQDPHENLGIGA